MNNVKLDLNDDGEGAFSIEGDTEQSGKMVIAIKGSYMTVFHTEVSDKAEGKGFAKTLLSAMVDYARKKNLKVIPRCTFVHMQFSKHPDEYADVWQKEKLER